MKKLLFLIIIVFLSFSFVQSKADCPPGYTEYSYNATYTYEYPSGGGSFSCHVTVTYCCKWDNVQQKIIIEITKVEPTYPQNNCLAYLPDIMDFFDWLHLATAEKADLSCHPIKPCDDNSEPYTITEINVVRCWYYKNFLTLDGEYLTILRKCDVTFKCVSVWKLCRDFNYSPPKLVKELISKSPIGNPTCSSTVPDLPPSGKEWDESWETECFSIDCN